MTELMEFLMIAALFSITVFIYFLLMAFVFPKYLLKERHSHNAFLGRGLRKIVTESERAIVYEPHPSVRKYLHKYALFTDSGFKKLLCNLDVAVSKIVYDVHIYDSKNCIVDVLHITDTVNHTKKSHTVVLPPETSYISISLQSVNDVRLNAKKSSYYRLTDILLYALCVFAVTMLAFISLSMVLCDTLNDIFIKNIYLWKTPDVFIGASAIISVASTLLTVWRGSKEGIKVISNDRKH